MIEHLAVGLYFAIGLAYVVRLVTETLSGRHGSWRRTFGEAVLSIFALTLLSVVVLFTWPLRHWKEL